jgi:SAM-dependent methyltransferase
MAPGRRPGIDPVSRRKIVATYERSLRRYGPHVGALKWVDDAAQQDRFAQIVDVGPWAGASVADVGCGLGDLFSYLRRKGHDVREYAGFDLSRRMVDAAREKHPDPAARFEVRDILAHGLGDRFDYVVASGTFNLKLVDHDRFLRRMLSAMYRDCRRAVAFNIFHPYPSDEWTAFVDWAGYYSVPRERVLGWCRRLSPQVETRPGVGEQESTFYVRRPASGASMPGR